LCWINSVRIGDPAQAARGDAGDAECNAVSLAQFGGAVFEQADERPVDVAEAEEAEVVSLDGGDLWGQVSRFRGFRVSGKMPRTPAPCDSETL
jgi:hypothetical protein